MKTLEELYTEVMGNEELKAAFVAAMKEKRVGEFLKAHGCDVGKEEMIAFAKMKHGANGEISDEELDSVVGGDCLEAANSLLLFGACSF